MLEQKSCLRIFTNESGITAVLAAILMVVLLGIAALGVDVGFVLSKRAQLQGIADAASLAAARELSAIYQGLSDEQQQSFILDDAAPIKAAALDVAVKNNQPDSVKSSDVLIGDWDAVAMTFTPTNSQPDAVYVRAAFEGANAVTTFFAKALGFNTREVRADATAALTGKGSAGPGDLEVPIGIAYAWFLDDFCNDAIKFSPTNDPDSCAGWNTWEISPSNDVTVRRILNEVPGYENEEVLANETAFEFIGGDLSTNTFDAFLSLFQRKGYDVDANGNVIKVNGEPLHDATGTGFEVPMFDADGQPLLYPDGTPRNRHIWDTHVVVYDWPDCSNPNTDITIIGFSAVHITDVMGPPYKTIIGRVQCDLFDRDISRGGGGDFGLKGSIPGLVE